MSHCVNHVPGQKLLYVGKKLVMLCYAPFDEPMLFTLTTPFKLQSLGRLVMIDQLIRDSLVTLLTEVDKANDGNMQMLFATMISIDEQISLDLATQSPIKLNDDNIKNILVGLNEIRHCGQQ
jgi:hypothetical protein